MAVIDLGIPARVAAGKTSPAERIFVATGVIPSVILIDTSGHDDLGDEVERSPRVLDAVVPAISAGEDVRPWTRRLARAIRAADLPLLIFVNDVNRLAARGETRSFPCTLLGH